MKKVLLMLSLAALSNVDVSATSVESQSQDVSVSCEDGYKAGFFLGLGLDVSLGLVEKSFEGNEDSAESEYLNGGIRRGGVKDVPRTNASAEIPAGEIWLYVGGRVTEKKSIKRSQPIAQVGVSIDLGYEYLVSPSFLVGFYASAMLSENKDKNKMDHETKSKTENTEYLSNINKDLDATNIESKAFSFRTGVMLGYVMNVERLVAYLKLGILKKDYVVTTIVNRESEGWPLTNTGVADPNREFVVPTTVRMLPDKVEQKYNRILPEIGVGFKKQFNNNFSVGFEAMYAIGTKKTDEAYAIGVESIKFPAGVGFGAHYTANSAVGVVPTDANMEAVRNALTEEEKAKYKMFNKVKADVVTFRVYASHTFA